jgi:putative transcriptional regulator
MPSEEEHRIAINLDKLLETRGLTLKNGRAKAIRFSTLTALCDALDCQPGDILSVRPSPDRSSPGHRATLPGS